MEFIWYYFAFIGLLVAIRLAWDALGEKFGRAYTSFLRPGLISIFLAFFGGAIYYFAPNSLPGAIALLVCSVSCSVLAFCFFSWILESKNNSSLFIKAGLTTILIGAFCWTDQWWQVLAWYLYLVGGIWVLWGGIRIFNEVDISSFLIITLGLVLILIGCFGWVGFWFAGSGFAFLIALCFCLAGAGCIFWWLKDNYYI